MKFNKFEQIFQNCRYEIAQKSMHQFDSVWKELLSKDSQICDEFLSSVDAEKFAELYASNTDRQTSTWRHLFEVGRRS